MSSVPVFIATAALLFALALVGLVLTHHLVRKILALNVMASAVFLLLGALAYRPFEAERAVDPVPHAMVLTGIVVSFSASALALGLARRIHAETGRARLPEEDA